MPKRVLVVLAGLVVVALTIQMVAAAPRKSRKALRSNVDGALEIRDRGSAPRASGSKSCDIIWCYGN